MDTIYRILIKQLDSMLILGGCAMMMVVVDNLNVPMVNNEVLKVFVIHLFSQQMSLEK